MQLLEGLAFTAIRRNRLCCITQVRDGWFVTASVDWISDGHLRRTAQTDSGRPAQRRHRSNSCVSAQRRIGRQDSARALGWHFVSDD